MEPTRDVFMLDVGITVALALLLPFARACAGARLEESSERRRLASVMTAVGVGAWLAATGGLAASGALENWERTPPPMFVVMIVAVTFVVLLARSRFGRTLAEGLSFAALVGYQAFRIAVEFMLHRAYEGGVIGVQMTWSGRNFDVVTGVSALVLGAWLALRSGEGERGKSTRIVMWAWNIVGVALLVNIVVVAMLSMPTRLLAFDGPPNAWVATFPYVWLPTVMVTAALFGHLIVLRRLLLRQERV